MKQNKKWFLLLHFFLGIYSLGSVFSKLAANYEIGSLGFFYLYGGVIGTLGIYAIAWQQIIKRMSLTAAFANKAVTVVWGLVWGLLFFDEKITMGKIVGAVLVVLGIVIFAGSDKEEPNVE